MRETYFQYKYVLLEDKKVVAWEEGVNRIADLDALPEVTDKQALSKLTEKQIIPGTNASQIKHCQFDDRWEEYTVRFTLFDPLYKTGDQMYLVTNTLAGQEQV